MPRSTPVDRLRSLGIATDEHSGSGAAWEGKASCSKCSAKLGRFSAAPQQCACGAVVEGPLLKVQSARVDLLASTGGTVEEMMEAARLRGELDDAGGCAAGAIGRPPPVLRRASLPPWAAVAAKSDA